jgi:sortase family protein
VTELRDDRRGLRCALGALAGLALVAAVGITTAVAIHPDDHLRKLAIAVPISIGNVPTAPSSAPARPAPPAAPLIPNRVRIPALGVDSRVVPVVVDRVGALGVPRDPHVIGWWADGAKPGAPSGTAILDGHVNYGGVDGSLAHLDRLRPGDVVIIDGTSGGRPSRQRFRVTGTRTYAKHDLPSQEVFNQRGLGRLVLVTCGGVFDRSSGNYADNILTYALPDTSAA